MEKYEMLAELMFPNVTDTIEDLENRYPERKIDGEVTRYAPSPTGFLHTGSLFTTLLDQKIAHQTGGVFYLRVEDTDKKREVEGSIEDQLKSLKEFGIVPDEGVVEPKKEEGKYGPYTQSKRGDIYLICAKELVKKGKAYPCFCTAEMLDTTRKMQEKNKQIPGYYGIYARCRNISVDEMIERVKSGEEYIVRFRSNGSHLKKISYVDKIKGKIEIAENDQDIVIVKSDGLPTYHFAHAVDDHFMRTTTVIRGEEWLPSVPIHLQLFDSLGFERVNYAHIPTIMIKDGESKRKLSKRKDKEAAVSYFLKAGYPPEAIIEYLYTIINSDFEPWRKNNKDKSLDEFKLRLEKMNSAGALFDIMKINDISKETISKLNSHELFERVNSWSEEYNKEINDLINRDKFYTLKIFAIERDEAVKIRKDLVKFEDIYENFSYFFHDLYIKDIDENGYVFETNEKITNRVIYEVLSNYMNIYDVEDDKDVWFSKIKTLATSLGFCTDMKQYKLEPDKYIGSIADATSIIRIAICNRKNTPDMYYIMKTIGVEEIKSRVNNVLAKF
ncbi:MAG: glutamate--tRNA ligase [Clostridia bacterium]|nr:glutamate--tRNA ligase [Clostridia bacterium]